MKKILICMFLMAFNAISVQVEAQSGGNAEPADETAVAFGMWFNWKVKNGLDEHQKEVVERVGVINSIYEEVRQTKGEPGFKDARLPDPPKNISPFKGAIRVLRGLRIPEICESYVDLTVDILESIVGRYDARMKTYGADEGREFELYDRQMNLEYKKDAEFMNILTKLGFYENMEKEMKEIGLIDEDGNLALDNKR